MYAYRYMIPDSSFIIYPNNGQWGLKINGTFVNDYSTAEAAAYDVASQNTGYVQWDLLEDVDAPASLSEWDAFAYEGSVGEMETLGDYN